jgi:hypothetical protein
MHPFEASWDRARSHFGAAERALGGAPHPARAEYRDWIEHNELELALDALEAAGADLGAGPAFWRALAAAAAEMGLAEHGARYASRLAGGSGDAEA